MSAASVLHILRAIKDRGSVSRTDLQQLTELSWGTITNTTRELLQRNLIREEGAVSTKAGRKPVHLAVNRAGHCLVGVEIAPEVLRCLMMNLGGETLWYEEMAISERNTAPEILERAGRLIQQALLAHSGRLCLGVGVALAGSLDLHRGVLQSAVRMPAWRDVHVRQLLQGYVGAAVRLEHHANCLALAERWFGEAGKTENILCVCLGETVGLGILLDDEIFRGSQDLAGDFGHITLDPEGPACTCGDRGCVEAYCSTGAIVSHAKSVLPAPESASRLHGIEDLAALAQAQNQAALGAFERLGKYLGIGVANLIDLFNPDLVVLSGEVMKAGACFMEKVSAEVAARTGGSGGHRRRELLVSRLGPRAAAMGACGLILQGAFENEGTGGSNGRMSVPA